MVRTAAVVLALCAVLVAVAAQDKKVVDCGKALEAAKVLAAAATTAKANTDVLVKLSVEAKAKADAMAKATAKVLSETKVKADVSQAGSSCILGTASSAVQSIAKAYAASEAQASARANAFATASASSSAFSKAQAAAAALSCGCESQVAPYLEAASEAFSEVESKAHQYQSTMAYAEDQQHKTALVFVETASAAETAAKPQCASCGYGTGSRPTTPSTTTKYVSPAGAKTTTYAVTTKYVSPVGASSTKKGGPKKQGQGNGHMGSWKPWGTNGNGGGWTGGFGGGGGLTGKH